MATKILPVGEYAPDQPAYANPGAALIRNAVPRTLQSYGPVPSPVAYSSALAARCQGAFAALDNAGNVNVFAGDASRLYRLTGASTNFADASKSGGYATAGDARWRLALYGKRVVATNGTDPVQSFVLGSSTVFADLSATGPTAKYAAVVRDFVALGCTVDPVDGSRPQRVWWSAIDDPTNWPTLGSNAAALVQSDGQDLVGEGGWVQGIVGGLAFADGAVFQERAIWRMHYAGPPAIFSFSVAEGARGTPAPDSIAQLGSVVYYLGEDGFYAFDGVNSRPIGANRVDKAFFADLDQNNLHRVSAAVDPINKLVFWAYPGTGNSGGNLNRLLIYNWDVDRWGFADDSSLNIEILFRSLSFGQTLDTLDSTGYTIDNLPFSLDSRVWTGGRVLLASFDASHRLNYFTGASLAATLETTEVELTAGRRSFVSATRPLVDGAAPTVALVQRDRITDATTVGNAVAVNAAGDAPQRSSARYHRARLLLAAGGGWNHAQGVEIIGQPEGMR